MFYCLKKAVDCFVGAMTGSYAGKLTKLYNKIHDQSMLELCISLVMSRPNFALWLWLCVLYTKNVNSYYGSMTPPLFPESQGLTCRQLRAMADRRFGPLHVIRARFELAGQRARG